MLDERDEISESMLKRALERVSLALKEQKCMASLFGFANCAAVTDAVVSVDAMSRAIASFDSDATAEEAIKCETALSGL